MMSQPRRCPSLDDSRRGRPGRAGYGKPLSGLVPGAGTFVVCAAHNPDAIGQTVDAVSELTPVYQRDLEFGIDRVLRGRPVRPAIRPRGVRSGLPVVPDQDRRAAGRDATWIERPGLGRSGRCGGRPACDGEPTGPDHVSRPGRRESCSGTGGHSHPYQSGVVCEAGRWQ